MQRLTKETVRQPLASSCDADDKLLRVREAAKLLALSDRKVNAMFATGELPRVKIGRATRVRLSDIQALIQRGAA